MAIISAMDDIELEGIVYIYCRATYYANQSVYLMLIFYSDYAKFAESLSVTNRQKN